MCHDDFDCDGDDFLWGLCFDHDKGLYNDEGEY